MVNCVVLNNIFKKMASYVFLMQFWNDTETLTGADIHRLTQISEIGGAITVIGCIVGLSLLCLLPVRSDGLFITGNLCLVLMAAQISFIGSENTGYPDPVMCKIATSLIQYFFLSVHFAAFAFAIYLGSKFGPSFLNQCRRRGLYLIIIWVLPFVVVVVTALSRSNYVGSGKRCWLAEKGNSRLFFLVPLAILLILNAGMYVTILRYTAYAVMKKSQSKYFVIRHVVQTSLTLIPCMGLHWALGYSVTFGGPKMFQYLFVILASTHGMLLLVFQILTNRQVQRSLCERIAVNESDVTTPNVTEPMTVDSVIDLRTDAKQE